MRILAKFGAVRFSVESKQQRKTHCHPKKKKASLSVVLTLCLVQCLWKRPTCSSAAQQSARNTLRSRISERRHPAYRNKNVNESRADFLQPHTHTHTCLVSKQTNPTRQQKTNPSPNFIATLEKEKKNGSINRLRALLYWGRDVFVPRHSLAQSTPIPPRNSSVERQVAFKFQLIRPLAAGADRERRAGSRRRAVCPRPRRR